MSKFLLKVIGYLLASFILASCILFVCIKLKPDYFLGVNPLTYSYCSYQHGVVKEQTAFKNVIIGDSRGNACIDPKIMGDTWINLSIPASNPFEGYLTLKHFLAKNKVDTILIVYGNENIRASSSDFEFTSIPLKFPSIIELEEFENIETQNLSLHKANTFNTNIAKWKRRFGYYHFPLYYRQTFLDGVSLCTSNLSSMEEKKRLFKINRGYTNFGELDSCNTILSSHNNNFEQTAKTISLIYLDSLMSLVKKGNMVSYLLMPPVNEATYTFHKINNDNSYFHYLKSNNDLYATLNIISNPTYLPNNCFGDSVHVNKRGTIFYSNNIKQKISNISNKKIMF
jgi:hypothetical protein